MKLAMAFSLMVLSVTAYSALRSVVDDSYDTVGTGARPTCDASMRGKQWFVTGGIGVADSLTVCVKGVFDTYAWSNLL